MKFEEAKDQVAKQGGLDQFPKLPFPYESLYKQAAELYARSMAAQVWDEACEAYEDILVSQNLEFPMNKPTNPYKL